MSELQHELNPPVSTGSSFLEVAGFLADGMREVAEERGGEAYLVELEKVLFDDGSPWPRTEAVDKLDADFPDAAKEAFDRAAAIQARQHELEQVQSTRRQASQAGRSFFKGLGRLLQISPK